MHEVDQWERQPDPSDYSDGAGNDKLHFRKKCPPTHVERFP